jgi:hypothetical protein
MALRNQQTFLDILAFFGATNLPKKTHLSHICTIANPLGKHNHQSVGVCFFRGFYQSTFLQITHVFLSQAS